MVTSIGQVKQISENARLGRLRLGDIADALAAALVASLPWSTSATGILAGLWLIAVIPTLDRAALRRILSTPAGALPVLLWGLGVVGMLWAGDVSFNERFGGLNSFHKLLFIPLLIAQFERSERAAWVVYLYVASCAALSLLSWYLVLAPGLEWRGKSTAGVPVKDYISQSLAFIISSFLLAALAQEAWRRGRVMTAIGMVLAILVFLANVVYVSTSRTALVVIPVLGILFAIMRLTWRQGVALLAIVLLSTALMWSTAQNIRRNIAGVFTEITQFNPRGMGTRAGERLVFWGRSVDFIAAAPLIGHGTGSIPQQFRKASVGHKGMAGIESANPHNQVFAVAIQLGMIGTLVLLAMWAAHAWQFRRSDLASWAGMVIVAQNIVGSLFNSHLFDFTQGWTYVIGVGIAAGAIRKASQVEKRPT